MRYSYEFKINCIELYRHGEWPETPSGVKPKNFHDKVREWDRMEQARGPKALKHTGTNKEWSPEEKLALVCKVISGSSGKEIAFAAGISCGLLYRWVHSYRENGYNGLVNKKRGRPPKEPITMKKTEIKPLTESEREELIRLRAENEYIKAEIEVIKKEIALREEKQAALLKAKRQRSSKNSEKKDTH